MGEWKVQLLREIRTRCTRCCTSISSGLMELLVVSSCTGEKDVGECPYFLTENRWARLKTREVFG